MSQASLTRTSSKARVALAFAVIYAVIGFVRHAHFGSNAYDLGIFDQMVWHLSRFERPASTIHGLSNMFGDHFSPIHALYVPLSWLWPSAQSLIATQAIALGLSIVPVWIFLERKLPARAALLMALAYGCFWGLQRTAQFDVHELAFAPVLIATMLLSLDRVLSRERVNTSRAVVIVCGVALCLVKEDQIPLVVAIFGLWALRTRDPRERTLAAILAAATLAIFVLVVKVVIPALNDTGAWAVGSAFGDVTSHPLSLFAHLVSPPVKLQTLLLWLLPFALLPLASPYGLLLVPLVLERFLSASPNHWGTSFHYTAPLAPILAMAAGDGLARLHARVTAGNPNERRHRPIHIAGVCLLLCAVLPGHEPMWKLLSPSFYAEPPFTATAARALSHIPPTASVVAQSPIAPHLSRREKIYMMRSDGPSAGIDAEFVIAAAGDLSPWPFATPDDVRRQVAMYVRRGYTTVFDEQGWIVLARGGGR